MSVQTGSKREGGGWPPFPSRLFCSLRSRGDEGGKVEDAFSSRPDHAKGKKVSGLWPRMASNCPDKMPKVQRTVKSLKTV